MHLIECDRPQLAAIGDIFNDAITNSTSLYDYRPRSGEQLDAWFASKRQGGFPVIGLVDDDSQLMGFASYGPFRSWPAYKYTVEHSLYVARSYRRRGVGARLLEAIVQRASDQQYHVLVGAIDAANQASITLHQRFGFTHVGSLKQVGFKFGRWLDVCLYQLILQTPDQPTDG